MFSAQQLQFARREREKEGDQSAASAAGSSAAAAPPAASIDGSSGAGGGGSFVREKLSDEVWAAMTPKARKAHAKKNKKKRGRKRSPQPPQQQQQQQQEAASGAASRERSLSPEPEEDTRAWRFAKYDRVRCNLGGEFGWVGGNVQALNEPYGDGVVLPYVVMLDEPLKRLISVPTDAPHCVRAEVCFAEGFDGGECAEAVAYTIPTKRARAAVLRFAVGERVACLTAGPDGAAWPRRWSAGTVRTLWHSPEGATEEGAVVPYAVELDPVAADAAAIRRGTADMTRTVVLAHIDDHLHIRSLALQPEKECAVRKSLPRFTLRENLEKGWVENVDQQTLRCRKAPPPDSDSVEEEEGVQAEGR